MTPISDALELLTAQHEQIEDLYEQVRQIGDEAAFVELADKLTNHLALEQELFYPVVASHVAPAVLSELLAEHAAIKQVLHDLQWLGIKRASASQPGAEEPCCGGPDFRPTLARLGELLTGHSAWQEDELFTQAAETMSREELAALCTRFYTFDAVAIAA